MSKLCLKAALLGAAVALPLSLGPPPVMAADHRDAPTIDDYSAIDINDVFMFRDPPCTTQNCTSPNLVVALSTQAVADPKFGSSYHFQENALYRLNFTTRADAKPTAHIDFVFSPFANGPACPTGPACQTYRAVLPDKTVVEGVAVQGTSKATHIDPTPFFAASGISRCSPARVKIRSSSTWWGSTERSDQILLRTFSPATMRSWARILMRSSSRCR